MATMFHMNEQAEDDKNNAPIREIVLKPIDGRPLDSKGLVDTRLFKGGNKLMAVMGDDSLWYCKFEQGIVPETLKVKFTSASKLINFVKQYYEKRNIEVTEVKNAS